MTSISTIAAVKSPVAAGLFGDCSILPDRPAAPVSAVIVPLFRRNDQPVRALAA